MGYLIISFSKLKLGLQPVALDCVLQTHREQCRKYRKAFIQVLISAALFPMQTDIVTNGIERSRTYAGHLLNIFNLFE